MIYGYIKNGVDKFSLLLPLCCFIAIFFALSYWAKISNGVWEQKHRELLNKLTITYAIEIENQIKHTLSPQRQIEKQLQNNQGDLNGIAELINDILANHHSILRISFSPDNITSVVFPSADNQHLIGRQIRPPVPDRKLNGNTLIKQQSFYSAPIKSSDDNVLFSINKPLYLHDNFWGYITYQLNISDIVTRAQLQQAATSKHSYQLSHVSNHHKLTVLAHSKAPLGHQVYSASVKVPENNWLLEVSFNNETISSLNSFSVLFRLLLTSAMTLIIYWALLEPRRLRSHLASITAKLAGKNIMLQSVLDNISDGVIACDSAGKVYLVNNAAQRLYKITESQQLDINSSCFQFYDDNGESQTGPAEGLFHNVLYRNEEAEQDIVITADKGVPTNLKAQSKILYDDQQTSIGAMLFVQDVSQLKQATNAHTSRNIILDMLAHDKPINEIFEHIINDIESNFDHLSGTILLLDNNKTHLVDVVAPKLPDFYIDSLNGIKVGDRVMSCGSAVHLNKMIIVEDIQTHPYWIDYKDLALQANIRSCWSQPIHSAAGEVLGSFDIYSSHVNPASPTQILALKEAATLTALTIERHRDSQRLRKISLAVQHSPNALIIIDNRAIIEYVNPKFCKITGYQPVELIGQSLDLLVPKSDNLSLYQEVWQTVIAGKDWRGEIKSNKKNGDAYWAYDHVSAIKDQSGKITKFVIVQEDITENRHQSEQLDYQQNHDLLTGLINLHAFNKKTQRAIKLAKSNKNQHALCFIDLDNFKKVNQQCGQMAGDEFLRQVSTILRGHLRQRDTLARLNADQFAILMKDCSTEPARRCCNELIQLLGTHKFVWQDQSLSINASIGITTIDQSTVSNEEVMKQADMACFLAKSSGGSQVQLYHGNNEKNAEIYGDARRALEIVNAFEKDNLKLFVMPVVPLINTEEKLSLEILLRLEQDDGKLLLPKEFLSVAQRYNLTGKLDLWVIENTLTWFDANPDTLDNFESIAINLSSSSFGDESQLIRIINLIEKYQSVANKITFEITEYTAMSSLSKAYNFMKALQQYKINFTLDNFGSGYLSFAQLSNIPISTINIDGRLIKDLENDKVSKVMVKSMCDVARVMGIKTVAKYVEDDAVIPALKQLSIDAVQGYSQSKPVSIDSLTISCPEIN